MAGKLFAHACSHIRSAEGGVAYEEGADCDEREVGDGVVAVEADK